MTASEHRAFAQADDVRTFPHGRVDVLAMGEGEVGRLTLSPGWRWSNDVKPIAKTDSCEAPHFQYHVSGQLGIRMDDGTEYVAGPGDVTFLPSGHDAWVIGEEDVVVVDWHGAGQYAR
jgi:hypothetical protein